MKRVRRPTLFAAALAAALPLFARAQYQVDNTVGQVDNRVNGEMYGNNGASENRAAYQLRLLPSEERFAIWRSGALPSEVQQGRTAAGPLTPNGVLDYLPPQSPLQRSMGLPSPRLYNPAYGPLRPMDQSMEARGVQRGFPQTVRQGVWASGRLVGQRPQAQQVAQAKPAQAGAGARPAQQTGPVAGLTPAPDQPLPTGQLFDDVKYDPNSTPGASFLHRRLPRVGQPKPPSLADEKQGQQGQQQPQQPQQQQQP